MTQYPFYHSSWVIFNWPFGVVVIIIYGCLIGSEKAMRFCIRTHKRVFKKE